MIRKFAKGVFRWSYSFLSVVVNVFPDSPAGNSIRGKVLGMFMKGSKRNLHISRSTNILYPYNIVVGDDVFIGFNSWLNAQGGISIGDGVILGPFVIVATGNHTFLNQSYRFGEHHKKPVKINAGVWVAGHASLVPGVVVGARSVVGSGSVVVSEIDEDSLYAGNPAKLIKRLR